MKVLIADDSEEIQIRLYEMLSEIQGIEIVGQAYDGISAIEKIRLLTPDVAILDIRMPGGTGLDVLKNIKKNKGQLIVIVLTNYPFSQYKKKCKELGADYFLAKSEEFNKVTHIIQHLIHKEKRFSNR